MGSKPRSRRPRRPVLGDTVVSPSGSRGGSATVVGVITHKTKPPKTRYWLRVDIPDRAPRYTVRDGIRPDDLFPATTHD